MVEAKAIAKEEVIRVREDLISALMDFLYSKLFRKIQSILIG